MTPKTSDSSNSSTSSSTSSKGSTGAADPAGTAGREASVELRQGVVDYRRFGAGQPIVFVHGLFVNGLLWRNVAPVVAAAGYECVVPDWPFGSHRTPLKPDADLSAAGVADLIADFLDTLDLRDAVLVANDTGGAFTQLALVRRSERVGAVVLTPSDSLECFFPPMFRYLQWMSRVPGSTFLVAQTLRIRALHRLPLVFGWLSKRPVPREVMDSYLAPMVRDAGIRRDLGKVLRGVHKRHTLAAAKRFPDVKQPVLLAWAAEDRLFRLGLAERVAGLIPGARLTVVQDSYTFVPEDQPAWLAERIVEFVGGLA